MENPRCPFAPLIEKGKFSGRSRLWFWSSLGLLLSLGNLSSAQAIPTPLKGVKGGEVCPAIQSTREFVRFSSMRCQQLWQKAPLAIVGITVPEGCDSCGETTLHPSNLPVQTEPSSTVAEPGAVADPETVTELEIDPEPEINPKSEINPKPEIDPESETDLDIDPQIIEDSPVLQRWLETVPDVATDIEQDPAFRTQLRIGYAEFPSTDQTRGIHIGLQDIFVGHTPLTLSAEYTSNGRGDRQLLGFDAQYYILPLGSYGNVAPVVGYRSIDTPEFSNDGVNVGFRIIVIPSRSGAADLSLTQSWVAPGTDKEIGLTTFSVGYAVTRDLRIATDIQAQNTPEGHESRVSLLLEWML